MPETALHSPGLVPRLAVELPAGAVSKAIQPIAFELRGHDGHGTARFQEFFGFGNRGTPGTPKFAV